MNPLVSIIMPVYNGEKYLHLAIESVLNQTFIDFEFIIINDGSTDKTYDIINNYSKKDNRIKIITNDKNIKIVKSLNIGLKKAKGKFIARIDSDDIWVKNKLEIQVSYLNKNNDIYLLGTSKYLINEKGTEINSKEKQIFSYTDILKNILKYNLFCHSSILFRKSIIETVGFYNEKYKNTEDYEYWIRIISKYKTEIMSEVLTYYRITNNMVSIKKRNQQNLYVIKAKFQGFKLISFSINYIPYLLGDIYRLLIPNFAIKFKKKLCSD